MTKPMIYMGRSVVILGGREIGTLPYGVVIRDANIGREMGYREVVTPQTPRTGEDPAK